MQVMDTQQKRQSGRWTKAEHKKFLKALEKYGRNWVLVQKVVKTRSLPQIRSHAQKVFVHIPEHDLDAYIGYDNESQEESPLPKAKIFERKREARSKDVPAAVNEKLHPSKDECHSPLAKE